MLLKPVSQRQKFTALTVNASKTRSYIILYTGYLHTSPKTHNSLYYTITHKVSGWSLLVTVHCLDELFQNINSSSVFMNLTQGYQGLATLGWEPDNCEKESIHTASNIWWKASDSRNCTLESYFRCASIAFYDVVPFLITIDYSTTSVHSSNPPSVTEVTSPLKRGNATAAKSQRCQHLLGPYLFFEADSCRLARILWEHFSEDPGLVRKNIRTNIFIFWNVKNIIDQLQFMQNTWHMTHITSYYHCTLIVLSFYYLILSFTIKSYLRVMCNTN